MNFAFGINTLYMFAKDWKLLVSLFNYVQTRKKASSCSFQDPRKMFHNDMGFVEKTEVELDKFTDLGWF